MQRGYYMPNRNSTHCSRHQCPYWLAASRILVAWWTHERVCVHLAILGDMLRAVLSC
jgi:hypothetical protein